MIKRRKLQELKTKNLILTAGVQYKKPIIQHIR